MSLSALLLFALATAALALSPGPNVLLVVTRTVAQGRRAGMLVVAGVECSFLIHLTATASGLTLLLFAIPAAYTALRLAGAAYLGFLAWQLATRPVSFVRGSEPRHAWSTGALFRAGFLSNALNPKAAAFYLAVFPQFLTTGGHGSFGQIALLGAVHISVSTLSNSSYVALAAVLPRVLKDRSGLQLTVRLLGSLFLAGFAAKLLTAGRPSTL